MLQDDESLALRCAAVCAVVSRAPSTNWKNAVEVLDDYMLQHLNPLPSTPTCAP